MDNIEVTRLDTDSSRTHTNGCIGSRGFQYSFLQEVNLTSTWKWIYKMLHIAIYFNISIRKQYVRNMKEGRNLYILKSELFIGQQMFVGF